MSDIIANKGSISGEVSSVGEISGGSVTKGKSLSAGVVARNTGGTHDYENLVNLPQVNNETLIGNKTTEDLKIAFSKTTAEWNEQVQLMSIKNAVYIYTDYKVVDGVNYPGIKIGDGLAYVIDLPFVTAEDKRISSADIANWNNKVAVRINGENLIFYT